MPQPIVGGEPATTVSTREGYDRWAAIYDDEGNPLIAIEEPQVDALLGPAGDLDVADLGCGTGRHAIRLARAGARVTAVDFCEGMVAAARRKPDWSRTRFIHHDITQPLPQPDQSFDRVLCCLVLDHVSDLRAFFAECRRICRPDGFVLASVMHPAMMLRGVQARFNDPSTGQEVRLESCPNQIADYVMGTVRAGLQLDHLSEHSVDDDLARRCPRAAKYLGWPILLMMRMRP